MSKKKALFILLISILFFLNACASARFITTGMTYPEWEGPVKIFQEKPKGIKYVEIGWVTGKMGGILGSDWADILEVMQEEAAEKGANGIILIDKDKSQHMTITNNKRHGFKMNSYDEKSFMAIAIRILKE